MDRRGESAAGVAVRREDRQCAVVRGARLEGPAGGLAQHTDGIQNPWEIGVLRSECTLSLLQRRLQDRFRFCVVRLLPQYVAKTGPRFQPNDVDIFHIAIRGVHCGHRLPELGFRGGKVPL